MRREADKVAEFRYKAINAVGRKKRGTVKAHDVEGAEMALRQTGLYALAVEPIQHEAWWKREIYFGRKVSTQEFAVFCRQLATLIRAGVTLIDSIRIMMDQSPSKPLTAALQKVAAELADGRQLSEAVQAQKDIFPSIFANMVHAGEISGTLDDALDRVARYFEKEYYTREKVKSALAYPAVLGTVSILVTVFLLVRIVPTFTAIFASYHAQLPVPTRIVLLVSHVVASFWWIIAAVILGVAVADRYLKHRVRQYQRYKHRLLLRLPIFGQLAQKTVVARMTRTMSSLFASAVPVLEGLQIVSEVVDNSVVADALRESAASLQEGRSLAAPFVRSRLFPPLVSQMIAIGEQSGNLDFMLEKIADFYEAEVEANADRLKSLLEPIMIIVLAVVVGTIVLAVLLPSFSLIQQLH